jgi:type I restriction-modification system DNA methylase subunit
VVDTLVRILEPQPGDTIYDPTCGSGGMLVHSANFLRENEHHATSAQYFGQPNHRIHALKAKAIRSGSDCGRRFGSVFRHHLFG